MGTGRLLEAGVRAGLMAKGTHTIPELDRTGLREFGIVTGGIVAVLFGLLFPWLLERSFPLWPWVNGAINAVVIVIGRLRDRRRNQRRRGQQSRQKSRCFSHRITPPW